MGNYLYSTQKNNFLPGRGRGRGRGRGKSSDPSGQQESAVNRCLEPEFDAVASADELSPVTPEPAPKLPANQLSHKRT